MTHITHLEEDQVLDYFWLAAREPDVDRIALLRQIASVRLARPSDWDRKAVREAVMFLKPMWLASEPLKARITLDTHACWVCRNEEYRIYLHHVIAVGHGGSSTPRNLVPLCHAHHRAVHPFMPPPTSAENRYGWTSIGDIAGRSLQRFERAWKHVAAE